MTITKPSDLSSADIERIVLASLINEGCVGRTEVKNRCRKELLPAAFRDPKHRALYKVIIHDERPLNLPLVWRQIEKRGLNGLLDKNYLLSMVEAMTGYAHIQYYIDELNECYANWKALTFWESQNRTKGSKKSKTKDGGDPQNERIGISFVKSQGSD